MSSLRYFISFFTPKLEEGASEILYFCTKLDGVAPHNN